MSNISELIKRSSMTGVEYVPLWSVTIWDKKFTSVDRKKQPEVYDYHYFLANELKPIVVEDGDVKILTTSTTNVFTTEELAGEYVVDREIVAIPWGGNPNVQYYKGKFITADNRIATSNDTSRLDNKFLYYCLQNKLDLISSFYRGSGIKHPDMSKVLDMEIPLPPIEVQHEIVHLLDRYTLLSDELLEKLATEQSDRKKQSGYYRDLILEDSESKEYRLVDVCEIIDCPHTSPKWKDSGIPVIRNYNLVNGIIDVNNLSFVDENEYKERIKRVEPREGDILFSREAPIGNVGIIPRDFKCCQGQRVVLLRARDDSIMPRFLLHALQGGEVRRQIDSVEGKSATVSNFNISDLKELKIHIPSLNKQRVIIERLDALGRVSMDMDKELSTEMALREKQYEYYRNELLSFKGGDS